MKYFVIALTLIFIAKNSFSQINEDMKSISNAEKFSAKAGLLIKKEFIDIGAINKAEIKVVHYTDLISNETISSVRFEMETASSYSSDTKIATLDSDEVKGLINSIKMMQENVFFSTPNNYTEVSYKSRGGFEAGCYWSKDDWKPYLKLEKFDGKSYVFMEQKDFPKLSSLLQEAQNKME